MTYFTLPHVHITSLKTTATPPMNISLNQYISSIEHIPKNNYELNTILPDNPSFFITAELIKLFEIDTADSFHLGTSGSSDYFKYSNIPHTYAESNDMFSLVICDIDIDISTILRYQKIGGNCILKITDSTTCIDLLYLLCACYSTVHLCKPETESSISSVKYAVCFDCKHKYAMGTFKMPHYFITKLDDINSSFGHYQLEQSRSKIYTYETKCETNKMHVNNKYKDWCLHHSIYI